jgi:hypothetical protein
MEGKKGIVTIRDKGILGQSPRHGNKSATDLASRTRSPYIEETEYDKDVERSRKDDREYRAYFAQRHG